MSKKKRGTFQPTLADRLLRAKPFAFETSLASEDCVQRLRDLAYRDRNRSYSASRTVEIETLDADSYNFVVCMKRDSANQNEVTFAKAAGSVWSDGGATYIEGAVRYGAWGFIPFLSFGAILIALVVVPVLTGVLLAAYLTKALLFVLILLGLLGIIGWRMWADRRNLLVTLRSTLEADKKK